MVTWTRDLKDELELPRQSGGRVGWQEVLQGQTVRGTHGAAGGQGVGESAWSLGASSPNYDLPLQGPPSCPGTWGGWALTPSPGTSSW